MSEKLIIRMIEVALVVGSFAIGAGVAHKVLNSGQPVLASTQLSAKFLEDTTDQTVKSLGLKGQDAQVTLRGSAQ